jgi:hypothetical protein
MRRSIPLVLLLALVVFACDDDPKGNNANNTNNTNNINNTNNVNNTNNINNTNNVNNLNNINNTNNLNNVTEFEAVPGARCTQENRVGTVVVGSYSGGGGLELAAQLYDRPGIDRAELSFSDAACGFWEAVPSGFCDPACTGDTACDQTGTCVPLPVPVEDLALTLHAGEQTQTFEPQYVGQLYGTVTLPGRAFAATLTFEGLTVRLAETTVPDPLPELAGTWHGGNEGPEGLDFAWTLPADPAGASVYTYIPINHHAASATHTECLVDADALGFSVAEAMLTPLAVVTGLEFQGLEHARTAAAVTPRGCVEFQWRVWHFVDWTYAK